MRRLRTRGWTKLVGAERLRPGGVRRPRERKSFTQVHLRLTSISKVTILPATTKGDTGHLHTGLCENTEVHTRDTLALVRFLQARVLPTSWKMATTVAMNTSHQHQFQRTEKRCWFGCGFNITKTQCLTSDFVCGTLYRRVLCPISMISAHNILLLLPVIVLNLKFRIRLGSCWHT